MPKEPITRAYRRQHAQAVPNDTPRQVYTALMTPRELVVLTWMMPCRLNGFEFTTAHGHMYVQTVSRMRAEAMLGRLQHPASGYTAARHLYHYR